MSSSLARTKNGQRSERLSEVASHLVLPDGIVSTGWPAVRDRIRFFGIDLDGWQDGLGRAAFGKRADGKYAAAVGGVVMSVPRQVGKTFLVGAIAFALCINEPGLNVIWTAHHAATSDETFDFMRELSQMERVAPFVERLYTPGGVNQTIRFRNGSRIQFGARERGFGRGKTRVGLLVLDEAQIMSNNAVDALLPTMNSVENPLMFWMGTPPKPDDASEAFTLRRSRALGGDSADTLYLEFSADDGGKLDDRKQWRKANPSFPFRTDESAILRLREALSDDSFQREALGVWPVAAGVGSPKIDSAVWDGLAVEGAPDGRLVAGVKFSVDGAYSALSVAVRSDSGLVHVDGLRLASTGEGVGWIVDWLAERQDVVAQVVIDGAAWQPVLVQALEDAGFLVQRKVKRASSRLVRVPSTADVVEAHAAFFDAVQEKKLSHGGGVGLSEQVGVATTRRIGRDGGWGWQSLTDTGNVTLLDAATLAFWGAKTVTRGKNRGVRVL